MANSWFRMYSEFAHDPKVQIMPESYQRRLLMLFCLRCEGKRIETFHETEIAFHMRISDDELAKTKAAFLEKNFIDERWNLLNWDRRQYVSDSSTDRVRKYRRALKQDETFHVTDAEQDETVSVTPPEQIQNRTDTEQKKTKAKEKPSQWELPSWIDRDAWNGFEEMRKKIRAPLTDRARDGIIRELEKMCRPGDNASAILDQSTEKAWRGVFPLSQKSNNGGSNGQGNAASQQGVVGQRLKATRTALAEAAIRRGWFSPNRSPGEDGEEIPGAGECGDDRGVSGGLRAVGPEVLPPEGR